jgi:hypothetical protein
MRRALWTVLVLAGLLPGALAAQLSWDAPPLVGPASPQGLGIFLASPAPGGNLGGIVTWRDDTASFGVGYRVGVGEDAGGHAAGLAGVDISGALANGVEDANVKVLWWTGLGGGVGQNLTLSWPLGVVVGWTGESERAVFSPYAGGHVALDLSTRKNDYAHLRGVADLGLDIRVVSGLVVSFGASVGGRDALAIGLELPTGLNR